MPVRQTCLLVRQEPPDLKSRIKRVPQAADELFVGDVEFFDDVGGGDLPVGGHRPALSIALSTNR
jgi:hypothetical protein